MVALTVAVVALRELGVPRTVFASDLAEAFVYPNLWLIALNLIPVPPLDGAEAWKLPRLLRVRAAARRARAQTGARQAAARELARLDARDDDVPTDTAAAVDARLRELADGSGKKGR
jgi:hypothetical protein